MIPSVTGLSSYKVSSALCLHCLLKGLTKIKFPVKEKNFGESTKNGIGYGNLYLCIFMCRENVVTLCGLGSIIYLFFF